MPKFLKPDPFAATVRIGARWRCGSLSTLDDRPLPEIQDGTFIELVLPAWAVTNVKEREKLTTRRTLDILSADSRVFLGLSPKAVAKEERKRFFHLQKAVPAASYLLAEVVLSEALRIVVDGSQRATLEPCRCKISLLNVEANSLNHALTLLSQRFEPDRLSHSGNVFRQGFTHLNGDEDWVSLEDLRLVKVFEFLRNISGTAGAPH